MVRDLTTVYNELLSDSNPTNCIIMDGTGRAFCAGGDVAVRTKRQPPPPASLHHLMRTVATKSKGVLPPLLTAGPHRKQHNGPQRGRVLTFPLLAHDDVIIRIRTKAVRLGAIEGETLPADFFYEEYALNNTIATMFERHGVPQVALWDGQCCLTTLSHPSPRESARGHRRRSSPGTSRCGR